MEVKKMSLMGSVSDKAKTQAPAPAKVQAATSTPKSVRQSQLDECFTVPLSQPELGQAIKKQREARGWSLSDLARMLKVSGVTVSEWERGEVRLTEVQVYDVAHTLGVSLSCFQHRVHEVKVAKVFPFHYDTFSYYRKRKGIDARELAAALDVPYTRIIADWESAGGGGTITDVQLEKLCELLDVSWKQLAEWDPIIIEGLSSEQRCNQYIKRIEQVLPRLNEEGLKRLSTYATDTFCIERYQVGWDGGKVH